MFRLSAFQSKGHNQRLFQQRVIWKYITVNSDLDRKVRICSFREGRVGISRYLNSNSTFATFGQSGLQFLCKRQISWFLEMISLLEVKIYRLTFDGKMKQAELKKKVFQYRDTSGLTTPSGNSGSSRFKCTDEKQRLSIENSIRTRKFWIEILKEINGKTQIWESRWVNIKSISGSVWLWRFQCKNWIDCFPINYSSERETLAELFKPVVLKKTEIWSYRDSSN